MDKLDLYLLKDYDYQFFKNELDWKDMSFEEALYYYLDYFGYNELNKETWVRVLDIKTKFGEYTFSRIMKFLFCGVD